MECGGKRKREDNIQEHYENLNKNIARKLICDCSSPVNFLSDVRPQPWFSNGGFKIASNRNQMNPKTCFQQKETLRIGLALSVSVSEINDQLELKLSQKFQQNEPHELTVSPGHHNSHMKASSIPALSLKIGNWEWESKNEGDLVAKFYYKTKKLVWEVLCGALKKKIEIQWSQISAINAYVDGNQTTRLELQLKEHPRLYEEIKLNPKMRTQWVNTRSDFTGGQTCICSQHTIRFAPRVLNGLFAKLLECDKRLSNLSQQPFPHQNPPVFSSQIRDLSRNRSIPAIVPNATDLAKPINSIIRHSSCKLPTPVLKFPSFNQRRNRQIREIPLSLSTKIDNILPTNVTDLMNDDELTNQERNFKTDSNDQSYEMKSTTTNNSGTIFEEHNPCLPVEATTGMNDSLMQEKKNLVYVDDQMFSAYGQFTLQEPNSWSHPEFNQHEFSNGGNGVNHIGYVVDNDEIFINSLWD